MITHESINLLERLGQNHRDGTASGEGDDALTRSLLWDQAANTLIPQFLREVSL
jgi:hypothetical protein